MISESRINMAMGAHKIHWRREIANLLPIFSKRERIWGFKAVLAQLCFSLLDLLGVTLIGILGAVTISGIETAKPGNRVGQILRVLHLENWNFQTQALILCALALLALSLRTIISMISTRRIIYSLSLKCADLTKELFYKIQNLSIEEIEEFGFHRINYAITTSIEGLVVRVFGTLLTSVTDIALIFFMSVALFVIDPLLAISSMVLFSLIALMLYVFVHKSAHNLGNANAQLEIESSNIVASGLNLFREISVRNGAGNLSNKLYETRVVFSKTVSKINYLPFLGKYIVESCILVGTAGIAAIQFMRHDAVHAAATVSMFLAAGSRIAPSFLRIQQGFVTVRGNLGMIESSLPIIDLLVKPDSEVRLVSNIDRSQPVISFEAVNFGYKTTQENVVIDLTFQVNKGQVVALVGPSGAGKSTIADLLVGVLSPKSGKVSILGCDPKTISQTHPGLVSYVPQTVRMASASLRENLMIGLNASHYSDEKIYQAIADAGLMHALTSQNGELNVSAEDVGSKLSGGEQQRFGLARALITAPEILVLDEATSSLDASTESQITSMLKQNKSKTTTFVIAHRLSTIQNADLVLYLDRGRIISSGKFEQVRSEIPEFDVQAKLMGL